MHLTIMVHHASTEDTRYVSSVELVRTSVARGNSMIRVMDSAHSKLIEND